MSRLHLLCRSAGLLAAAALPLGAAAQAIDPEIFPNAIGGGLGSTTQYSGSAKRELGGAPLLRYQFKNSQRNVMMVGPILSANLLESERWRAGPLLNVRFGRQDVDDAVVKRMQEVDDTVEGGAYVSYGWSGSPSLPWKLRLSANVAQDLGGVHKGSTAALGTQFWMPLSRELVAGIGGSLNYGSAKYMSTYYGVSNSDALNSGLPAYQADGGIRSRDTWLGLMWMANRHWVLGTGLYLQRLAGSAADSPLVRERGKRDQISAGAGAAYIWY